MCGSLRPQTQGGLKFHAKGSLIQDEDNNLCGEFEQLTREDLKERLIVAEKVMKTLFQRNKELEDNYNPTEERRTTAATS